MKGILLAGGSGTRLHPTTKAISKQLLPIYDKPMVYYPLTTLMLAGIREILLITTEMDLPRYQLLLNDGAGWGINIQYAIQEQPRGIAESLVIGQTFIENDDVMLILGDNVFYGNALPKLLQHACENNSGATIFAYPVQDASRYGVVEFDMAGFPVAIEEKPEAPKSRYAVTGLYIYDSGVSEIAKKVAFSERGEMEITDVNLEYLRSGRLSAVKFGRGMAWLDTGTSESLLEASQYVHAIEKRQGMKVACPEEIAYRMGFITKHQLSTLAAALMPGAYGEYLVEIAGGYYDY